MRKLSIVYMLALLLVACGPTSGGGDPTPTTFAFPPTSTFMPTTGPLSELGLEGDLIYSRGLDGVWKVDLANGSVDQIFQPPEGASVEGLGASPDGSQLVLAYFDGDSPVIRTDLYVMNADGSDLRPLLVHTGIFEAYLHPTWSEDGEWIYFTHSDVLTDDTGSAGEPIITIERVRPEGGEAELILENAEQPSISSDGTWLVHLRLNPDSFRRSLWIARLDGSEELMLVAETAFELLLGARLSPDRQTVVFAASGAYRADQPAPAPGWQAWLGVSKAEAHGLPWDLWTIPSTGGEPFKLTDWYTDSPWPAWSPDGERLAALHPGGVVLIEAAGARFVAEAHGHGELVWVP